MLILSSSLIVSGCYSPNRKYLLKSVISNNKEIKDILEKRMNKLISIVKIKKDISTEIDSYLEHGYPFAKGITNIQSEKGLVNIDVNIEKGDYVVINDLLTNVKNARKYIAKWGKNIKGKSYNEKEVKLLWDKISSISFIDEEDRFKILKKENKYYLYFPLVENKQTIISGNLSYNNQGVNGRLSLFSNSIFGQNGNIRFMYSSIDNTNNLEVRGNIKNVGYSDFDIIPELNYSVRDSNDYLINGELSLAYKSYYSNFFAVGIGMNMSGYAGNGRYVFIENSINRRRLDFKWRIAGNKRDTLYYAGCKMIANYKYNTSRLSIISSLSGNYIYPVDSLPNLMRFDLGGFNGVRGYKSMVYTADKFLMSRNDMLYKFNNFIAAGIIIDCAYLGEFIYSSGITAVIYANESKMRVNIATPVWNSIIFSIISGEISYAF